MLAQRLMSIALQRLHFSGAIPLTAITKNNNETDLNSFDITAALALFRLPLIAPLMTEVEQNFCKTSAAFEAEQSLKSNFELKHDQDCLLIEKRKVLESEGKDLSQLDEQLGISSLMLLDKWKKRESELNEKLGLLKKHTEKDNDYQSLRRKLNRKLILLVREKFSSTDKSYVSPWILPQSINSGEPLRETIERFLSKLFTDNLNIRVLGNAPFSYMKYVYPKPIAQKTGFKGALIFFYSAELLNNNSKSIKVNKEVIADHRWCTVEEVNSFIKLKKYKQCLETAFIA